MISTVGELKKLLSAYNPSIEITVVSHAHEGSNAFSVDRLEICHHINSDKVGLAIMAHRPKK